MGRSLANVVPTKETTAMVAKDDEAPAAPAPSVAPPDDNFTSAVNYSVPNPDLPTPHCVECEAPTTNGAVVFSTDSSVEERDATNFAVSCPADVRAGGVPSQRRPKRKRTPKKAAVEKSVVKYDMNLTPGVRRNKAFLHSWRVGEALTPGTENSVSPAKTTQEDRASRWHRRGQDGGNGNKSDPKSSPKGPRQKAPSDVTNLREPCESCRHFPFCSKAHPEHHENSHPFPGDESVVWVPPGRSEWDDCVEEMTAVCTEAALRRHAARSAAAALALAGAEPRGRGRPKGKPGSKPPLPPLSLEYIRDRVDIDDPLRGYQIRHRSGGWLQGFVLTTTFTTWTHYFKWDSTHPKSGMRSTDEVTRPGWELSGALGEELERQPRDGDPMHSGVIWPTVAEISIVGALGCGEYLLRMALDDILRRDCYDYVVLQATDTSRAFYEKFGFIRVGAITKYGSAEAFAEQQQGGKITPYMRQKLPIVGYRHWTYADESSHQLSKHGGPSFMMALRVDRTHNDPNGAGHHCAECGRAISKASFLDAMSDRFVHDKPKVSPTAVDERKMLEATASTGQVLDTPSGDTESKEPNVTLNDSHTLLSPKSTTKALHPTDLGGIECTPSPPNKRKKLNGQKPAHLPLKKRPPPPPSEDVWLAVQPLTQTEMPGKRKPPRPRSGVMTLSPAKEGPDNRNRHKPEKKVKTTKAARVIAKPRSKTLSLSPTKKCTLRKQRIPAMYRDPHKVYYYNKVVTPKRKGSRNSTRKRYYFVLHYDEEKKMIRIIPLVAMGTFEMGKRMGHVRWKATVVSDELKPGDGPQRDEEQRRYFVAMGVKTVPCAEWEIVPAQATNKGTGVAEESWDIFD